MIMPPAMMTLRPDVSPYLPSQPNSIPLAATARAAAFSPMALGSHWSAAPVRRVLFGRTVTMLGFNRQYPGPLIQVTEKSTITVRFINHTDFPTAIHWHGGAPRQPI